MKKNGFTPRQIKRLTITAAQKEAWTQRRIQKANTVGSCWIFFRDGDADCKHLWSAREIRIVEVIVPGKRFYAELVNPFPASTKGGLRSHAAMQPGVRRVINYSELW